MYAKGFLANGMVRSFLAFWGKNWTDRCYEGPSTLAFGSINVRFESRVFCSNAVTITVNYTSRSRNSKSSIMVSVIMLISRRNRTDYSAKVTKYILSLWLPSKDNDAIWWITNTMHSIISTLYSYKRFLREFICNRLTNGSDETDHTAHHKTQNISQKLNSLDTRLHFSTKK